MCYARGRGEGTFVACGLISWLQRALSLAFEDGIVVFGMKQRGGRAFGDISADQTYEGQTEIAPPFWGVIV